MGAPGSTVMPDSLPIMPVLTLSAAVMLWFAAALSKVTVTVALAVTLLKLPIEIFVLLGYVLVK